MKRNLIIGGSLLLIGFVLGMVLSCPSRKTKIKTNTVTVIKTDSVTIYDTVKVVHPIPKDSTVIKYQIVSLPVASSEKNSSSKNEKTNIQIVEKTKPVYIEHTTHDTVQVEVPITQKIYSDSLYKAYVSGFQPSLDSIQVYPKKDIIHHYITTTTETTKEVIKNRRFSISLTGGYGYGFKSKDFQPFIGVGVSWRLF